MLEERAIFWITILLVGAFFVWQVVSIGSGLGLFRHEFFSSRFWDVLWQALVIAWKYRLGPIVIFFDILLVVLFTIALVNYWPMAPRVKFWQTRPPVHTRKVRFAKDPAIARHWGAILNRVKSGTQDAMKYSILEADSLVDHFLKSAGFTGEHMADRLTQIVADHVPSLERVWKAHRLRNELAHTPGATVTVHETKEALSAFRDFLVELGAM
jgi:hypothetical protein